MSGYHHHHDYFYFNEENDAEVEFEAGAGSKTPSRTPLTWPCRTNEVEGTIVALFGDVVIGQANVADQDIDQDIDQDQEQVIGGCRRQRAGGASKIPSPSHSAISTRLISFDCDA
jgi:hypothetical protein